MSEWKDKLKKETIVSEGYLTGLFWNNPDLYNFYPEEKLSHKNFLNEVYGYYFTLGRKAQEKGIKVFDDISISEIVKITGTESSFEKYGNIETIQEIRDEVLGKEDNLDAYYSEIKKYVMIRQLVGLFGEAVIENHGKYDYRKMTKEQIHTFWNDKVNKLALDGDNKYEEEHLLKGLKDRIKDWNEHPSIGLPFYGGKKMTKITTGWDYGHVYIWGGYGGSGKTAISFVRVIMSCIEHQEKIVVIANEQSTDEFAKIAIIAGMGNGTKKSFNRQRINEGDFKDDEYEKMIKSAEFLKELSNGEEDIVTFVYMESYIMDDVKKIVRHYANRGVRRFMVDTARPSDSANGSPEMVRWERFVEDFKELYNLARPNGGGLNVAIWANVQLSDASLNRRFLNEHAFGDSKKIKNQASVVWMFRNLWDDEYENGKFEITVTDYVKAEFGTGYIQKDFTINKSEGQILLLFTPKNRRGQDNKNGQKVLVLKPNFNSLTYEEIGWTTIYDDKNY